jgi:hypothetical protein
MYELLIPFDAVQRRTDNPIAKRKTTKNNIQSTTQKTKD